MNFATRVAVATACTIGFVGGCVRQRWRDEAPGLTTRMQVAFPAFECWRLTNGAKVCSVEIPGSPVVAVGLSLRIEGRPDPLGFDGATAATMEALFSARDVNGQSILKRDLAGLGARANIEITDQGALVWTHSQPMAAARALAVLAAVVKAPVFAERDLRGVRMNQCERARAVTGAPDTLAELGLHRRLLPAGHPVAQPALRGQICHEELTLAEAVKVQQAYIGPSNVALVVAGDVAPNEVDAWARQALGGWTRRTSVAPPAPAIGKAGGGVTIVNVPGLVQTVIMVGGLTRDGERADDPALKVAGVFLQNALHMALREEMGATYGVTLALVPVGERAIWQIRTRVETGQTGRALGRLWSELLDLNGAERPSDATIFTVRINHLTAAMVGTHTVEGALLGASQMHWYSRPVDYYGQMPARVGDIDGNAVLRVLQGAFDSERAELVLVGDAKEIQRQVPELLGATVVLPIQVTDEL